MASKINCRLIATSDVEHLQQIYTGFSLLHAEGYIDLRQEIPREFTGNERDPDRWVDYKFFNTIVVVNERTRICYDVHDWNWIDPAVLESVDFYFKRSFDPEYVSTLEHGARVFPLGLNYEAASPRIDLFKLRRSAFYLGKEKLKAVAGALVLDRVAGGGRRVVRLDTVEAEPDTSIEPRVVFMTRAWDTSRIEAKHQKELVEEMNASRAECVRALRKRFGDRFFGGLIHDDYSREHFSDCLLPDPASSRRSTFLQTLRSYPICVTTTGLNRSNGWKLAEYVAMSKAIVTEPLAFQVPGGFEEDRNYLEFASADSLVESVGRLFEDAGLRGSMMSNNHDYYRSHLRADALIRNTLDLVMERTGA